MCLRQQPPSSCAHHVSSFIKRTPLSDWPVPAFLGLCSIHNEEISPVVRWCMTESAYQFHFWEDSRLQAMKSLFYFSPWNCWDGIVNWSAFSSSLGFSEWSCETVERREVFPRKAQCFQHWHLPHGGWVHEHLLPSHLRTKYFLSLLMPVEIFSSMLLLK